MSELKQPGDPNNASLVIAMESLMAKYFGEAEEKAEARLNRLEKRIDGLHSTLTKHTEEIKVIRADTANLKVRVTCAEETLSMCVETMRKQQGKLTEMEDRTRRDNFLVLNLKEEAEGTNALSYITAIIPKWFPAFADVCPELMRCHRLGRLRMEPRADGGPRRPRPLIVKCLRYTDRDRILQESRKHPPEVDKIQLKFAADYSEATAKRRKVCYKVMHEARVKGFQAFLLYPATIKLSKGNAHHTFDEPSQAESFISSLDK
ncbi:unnamed protein product [Knipowitschia caucasica]